MHLFIVITTVNLVNDTVMFVHLIFAYFEVSEDGIAVLNNVGGSVFMTQTQVFVVQQSYNFHIHKCHIIETIITHLSL